MALLVLSDKRETPCLTAVFRFPVQSKKQKENAVNISGGSLFKLSNFSGFKASPFRRKERKL
ncbi:hypothetical protein QQP08_004902 [Theobroma cacao]|nr:hypothetical protein QQP08_004902 [Theobroma cacao]